MAMKGMAIDNEVFVWTHRVKTSLFLQQRSAERGKPLCRKSAHLSQIYRVGSTIDERGIGHDLTTCVTGNFHSLSRRQFRKSVKPNPLYPRACGGAGAEGLKKRILIINTDYVDTTLQVQMAGNNIFLSNLNLFIEPPLSPGLRWGGCGRIEKANPYHSAMRAWTRRPI